MNKKYLKYNNGFTLVEIMVAMSIFMIVVLIALGSLLIVSNTAKKASALHKAMDNVNFAMESMTRSLRTGTNYNCVGSGGGGNNGSGYISLPSNVTANCATGGVAIAFTPQEHYISDTMYYFDQDEHSLRKCTYDSDTFSTSCPRITSPNVVIDELKFFVKGTQLPPTELIQPSVYIIIKGYVVNKESREEFSLQTMVSQRSSE